MKTGKRYFDLFYENRMIRSENRRLNANIEEKECEVKKVQDINDRMKKRLDRFDNYPLIKAYHLLIRLGKTLKQKLSLM